MYSVDQASTISLYAPQAKLPLKKNRSSVLHLRSNSESIDFEIKYVTVPNSFDKT